MVTKSPQISLEGPPMEIRAALLVIDQIDTLSPKQQAAVGAHQPDFVAETFVAMLKQELVNRRTWPSRLELQSAAFEYIEAFYNRRRRHSTLGMLSQPATNGSLCSVV